MNPTGSCGDFLPWKDRLHAKSFTEADYAQLLDAAHQQLGGPLVVVWWGNLNAHVSAPHALSCDPTIEDLLGQVG